MQKYYAVAMIVANCVLFILLVLSTYFQSKIFSQTSYSTAHLTRTSFGYFTIRVQHFDYYYNGTATPTSGIIEYSNYPFIICYIFPIVNSFLAGMLLRSKQDEKRVSKNFDVQVTN